MFVGDHTTASTSLASAATLIHTNSIEFHSILAFVTHACMQSVAIAESEAQ